MPIVDYVARAALGRSLEIVNLYDVGAPLFVRNDLNPNRGGSRRTTSAGALRVLFLNGATAEALTVMTRRSAWNAKHYSNSLVCDDG
jgi:hypothetical protein